MTSISRHFARAIIQIRDPLELLGRGEALLCCLALGDRQSGSVIGLVHSAYQSAPRNLRTRARGVEQCATAPHRGDQSEIPIAIDPQKVLIFVDCVLGDEARIRHAARRMRRRVVRDAERVSCARQQRCFRLS